MGLLEYVRGVLRFSRVYSSVFSGRGSYVKFKCRVNIGVKILGGVSEYVPYFFKNWICSVADVSDNISNINVFLGNREVCINLVVSKESYDVCFKLGTVSIGVAVNYGADQQLYHSFFYNDRVVDGIGREELVKSFSWVRYWDPNLGVYVPEVVGYAYDILEIMYRNLKGKEVDVVLLGMFP